MTLGISLLTSRVYNGKYDKCTYCGKGIWKQDCLWWQQALVVGTFVKDTKKIRYKNWQICQS